MLSGFEARSSSDFECPVAVEHGRAVISSAKHALCSVFWASFKQSSCRIWWNSFRFPWQTVDSSGEVIYEYIYICICVALDIFKFNCIFYRLSTGVVNYMEYGQRCQKPNLGFLIWYYYGSEPARMPFAGYDRWRLEYWYQDGTAVTVVDEYRRYVVGSKRLLYGRAPCDLWWHNAFFDLGSQGCVWWTPADKVKNPRRSNYELWPATTLFSCVLLGLHPCVFLRSCCCLCN